MRADLTLCIGLLPWLRKVLAAAHSTSAVCKSLGRTGGSAAGRTPAAAQTGTCRTAALVSPSLEPGHELFKSLYMHAAA